jgi:hypothetical protein
MGSWNLGGVTRLRRNPAKSAAAGSVVARREKRRSGEGRWGSGRFYRR